MTPTEMFASPDAQVINQGTIMTTNHCAYQPIPPACDDTEPHDHDHVSRDEAGQATAEYALLTGAIALVIALVAAWATSTGKVAALLDAVFDGLVRAAG